MMELVRWTETEKKQEKSGEKRKINGATGAKKLEKNGKEWRKKGTEGETKKKRKRRMAR